MAEKKVTAKVNKVEKKAVAGDVIVRAESKNVLQSPYKLQLVADMVRGKYAEESMNVLTFTRKKAAAIVKRTLKSAIANAEHNFNLDKKSLVISKIMIGEALKLPRYRFASRGRVEKRLRRRSHVIIELSVKK